MNVTIMTCSIFTEDDVCSAFDGMKRRYESMLRKKFSHLFIVSVKKLKTKFKKSKDKKRFIEELKIRYGINRKMNSIKRLLYKIREKQKWGLECYENLYSILVDYIDVETRELRKDYEHLVTGWFEVRAFFDRYKRLVKKNYASSLKIRYKVAPPIIATIKSLWEEVCEQFALPPLKVLLYDKRYGSLILTWVIDTDEETNIIVKTLLIQNLQVNIPFLEQNNITHLIYNFEVIYDVSVGPVIYGIANFPLLH